MKHKVCELEGALLDAAVALAEGWVWRQDKDKVWQFTRADGSQQTGTWAIINGTLPVPFLDDWFRVADFFPSTDWEQGGPIIEREGIELFCIDRNGRRMGEWQARLRPPRIVHGPTALVAAMRAFVMAKLGEEIELP